MYIDNYVVTDGEPRLIVQRDFFKVAITLNFPNTLHHSLDVAEPGKNRLNLG